MRSPKIYLGVPTDGTHPTEYARQLHRHIHVIFGLAFKCRPKPVTDEQYQAFMAMNRLQDELLNIAFPPNRGRRK